MEHKVLKAEQNYFELVSVKFLIYYIWYIIKFQRCIEDDQKFLDLCVEGVQMVMNEQ